MCEELKNRQKQILRGIVSLYIQTATPVSSSHLMNGCGLNCSSATIRNEMAVLEEMGYIQQPHTSAGRIPTDKGYRCYVDHLMVESHLMPEETRKIHYQLRNARGDLNALLNQVSKLLGSISHELGIVLTPSISWSLFDRLELIELNTSKVLVVIHVQNRAVKTVVLQVEGGLTAKDLQKTASYLNERLSGLTIQQVRDVLKDPRFRENYEDGKSRTLMRNMQDAADRLFNLADSVMIHTCGAQHIMMQPEFSNAKTLGPVFNLMEDQHAISNLLICHDEKLSVSIGRENSNFDLHPFSVIRAGYKMGQGAGTVGLIGPTRMNYRSLLPLVNYMTRAINDYLS